MAADKPEIPAPTSWNWTHNSPALTRLDINGTFVRYTGPGQDDSDAAAVLANHPVPSDAPLFYWEVEIVSKGRNGFIGIGFSGPDVNLERLPGWEKHSYAYHGDDGNIFREKGTGIKYGPMFTTGDVIGVVFDRLEQTISFTKNGYDLGVAFENVPDEELYPTVGFRTPGEEIRANFVGDPPFRANADAIREEARQRLFRRVRATGAPVAGAPTGERAAAAGAGAPAPAPAPALARVSSPHAMLRPAAAAFAGRSPPSAATFVGRAPPPAATFGSRPPPPDAAPPGAARKPEAGAPLPPDTTARLVFDYLVHHGHWETAARVASDALGGTVGVSGRDVEEHRAQAALRARLAAGDVDGALDAAERLAPGSLDAAPGVRFRLHVQRMVELIGAGRDLEAVAVGKRDLEGRASTPEDRAALEEALSLFAYADPRTSPHAHLLTPAHREELGAALTRATLEARGKREQSALEAAVRQVVAVYGELGTRHDPAASVLDPQDYLSWAVRQP